MAQLSVCLLCCKTFESCIKELNPTNSCELPVLSKFVKFAENCLHIPVEEKQLEIINGGGNVFCEQCEFSVVNPICQVYSQLTAAQLRLAGKLEQLGNILENSESTTTYNATQVDEFREVLKTKCKLK